MTKEDIYSQLLQIECIKEEQNRLSALVEEYEVTHGTSLCYYQILSSYDQTRSHQQNQVAQHEIKLAQAQKQRDQQAKKTYHID